MIGSVSVLIVGLAIGGLGFAAGWFARQEQVDELRDQRDRTGRHAAALDRSNRQLRGENQRLHDRLRAARLTAGHHAPHREPTHLATGDGHVVPLHHPAHPAH